MKKFEVQLAFEEVARQQLKWTAARAEYNKELASIMRRLVHEAIANRMSVEQIANYAGMSKMQVRSLLRNMGLDPRWSPTLLADTAAKALQENAELLGVDPLDMDLTSPLAYLPMGRELRDKLQSEAVKGVKDVD